MYKVIILGNSGKVGSSFYNIENSDFTISLGIDRDTNISDVRNILDNDDIDFIIDFSCIGAVSTYFPLFWEYAVPIVSGTTGMNNNQYQEYILNSKSSIFHADNMSPTIYALRQFIAKFQEYDCGILDIHRSGKLDSPSGTANFLNCNNTEQVTSFRLSDIFGEHMVLLANGYETIELRHRVLTRDLFAINTIKIGQWLMQQKTGVYFMQDFVNDNIKKD